MKVTLKKAFSIVDGRLSTNIEDVYEMLDYIFTDKLMTHQLPTAMRILKDVNPEWFQEITDILNDVKKTNNTNDFNELMVLIDKGFPTYEFELGKIDKEIEFSAGLFK